MNSSSSDQTKTDPVPTQIPSVTNAPLISSPAQNTPPSTVLPSENPLPLTSPVISTVSVLNSTTAPPVNPPKSPPPFALHSDKPPTKSHKLPLIVAALFLLVTAAGFGGSFLYFGVINKENKKIAANLPVNPPPPPVALSPTPVPPSNIFVTPSVSFRNLFSANVFASDNPFDETVNPFTGVTGSSDENTNAYQNPFEGQ